MLSLQVKRSDAAHSLVLNWQNLRVLIIEDDTAVCATLCLTLLSLLVTGDTSPSACGMPKSLTCLRLLHKPVTPANL